jgi:hypothetical protein
MAITNAQQYQQLVNKPADGKRPGYRGDAAYGASSRSEQATSIGQAKGATGLGGGASLGDGRDRDEAPAQQYIGGKAYDVTPETKEQRDLLFELENERKLQEQKNFITAPANYPEYLPGYVKFLTNFNRQPNRKYLVNKVLKGKNASQIITNALGLDEDGLAFAPDQLTASQLEQVMDTYMTDRMSSQTDAMGNPIAQNDGGNQPIIPLTPYQKDVAQQEEVDPNSLEGLLANRIAYRFMADGGRAGFMGGGMPYEGGMMDLESARQMYGLGKLVKKATGAIKKIVKSPVGKAALLYFGGNALMNKSGGLGIKDFLTRSFLGKEVSGGDPSGRGRTGGIFQFMKDNPLLTIAGGSTLAGLLSSSRR